MHAVARRLPSIALFAALLAVIPPAPAPAADLSAELQQQLAEARFVYISSERKSGEWSKPAEIWFMWDQGAVYVGTKPTTWRVKRINAGRKKARIAVGKVDGPSFEATGEVVKDTALQTKLMETYARKYPDGWTKYESVFRDGFKSGGHVLVRYTPK